MSPGPGSSISAVNNDIAEFVRMAQEEGLDVILRPGPYICGEWEAGDSRHGSLPMAA